MLHIVTICNNQQQLAVEIGKQFQLSARTVDDILYNVTSKALEKRKAGLYRKI